MPLLKLIKSQNREDWLVAEELLEREFNGEKLKQVIELLIVELSGRINSDKKQFCKNLYKKLNEKVHKC